MQLTGKNIVNASPGAVWNMLMDTDTLARIVPGVSKLEKTGDNIFKSTLNIKLGPVSGAFNGLFQLEEITPQKGFSIKATQNSKIGNANAVIKINLHPLEPAHTEISFNGEVRMTGLLAGMGQRVMGGFANTLTNEFFTNLNNEIQKGKISTPT